MMNAAGIFVLSTHNTTNKFLETKTNFAWNYAIARVCIWSYFRHEVCVYPGSKMFVKGLLRIQNLLTKDKKKQSLKL